MCFQHALANNKKTPDGKQHIPSIISNEFTYEELKLFFKIMQIKYNKLIQKN